MLFSFSFIGPRAPLILLFLSLSSSVSAMAIPQGDEGDNPKGSQRPPSLNKPVDKKWEEEWEEVRIGNFILVKKRIPIKKRKTEEEPSLDEPTTSGPTASLSSNGGADSNKTEEELPLDEPTTSGPTASLFSNGGLDKSDDSTLPNTTSAVEDSPLRELFTDTSNRDLLSDLYSFLSPSDLMSLSLTSKGARSKAYPYLMENYLMKTNTRRLQDIEWANGPARGTPENFRFNAAMWEVIKLIGTLSTQGNTPSKNIIDELNYIVKYIERFYKDSHPDLFARTTDFINSILINIEKEWEIVSSGETEGDREMMRLCKYFQSKFDPEKDEYADKRENGLMGPVARHFLAQEKRIFELGRIHYFLQPEEIQKRQKNLEFVIQNSFERQAGDYLFLGDLHFNVGNYIEATGCYEEVIRGFPGQGWIGDHQKAGKSYFMFGNYAKAAQSYEEGIKKFPDSTTIRDYRKIGDSYFNLHEYVKAAQHYKEGIKKFPDQAKIQDYRKIGDSYFNLREYAKAANSFEEVIEKFPRYVVSDDYIRAGEAYEKLGDTERAAPFFKEAIYLKELRNPSFG